MPRRARASHVESSTTRCSAMVEAYRSEGGPSVPGASEPGTGAAGARDGWGRGALWGSSCGTVDGRARAAGFGGWHVLLVRRPDRPAPERGETPGRSADSGWCPGLPPRHPPTWPLPCTASPASPSTACTGGAVRCPGAEARRCICPAVCGRPGTQGRLRAYTPGRHTDHRHRPHRLPRSPDPAVPEAEMGRLVLDARTGRASARRRIWPEFTASVPDSRSWSRPPVPPSQEGGSASSVGLT